MTNKEGFTDLLHNAQAEFDAIYKNRPIISFYRSQWMFTKEKISELVEYE